MSTKNGHITPPPYISHVRLKGYKSIIDTKVDLHPGLNIIIGPNGSGKTNFLEFLEKILHVHFPPHNFHVSIEISHNNEVNIWEAKFHSQSNIGSYSIVEWYYSKGKKKPEKNIHHLLNDGYIQGHPSKYIEAMNFVGWKLSGNLIQFTMPHSIICLLYTSPSPRDGLLSRMPSSA